MMTTTTQILLCAILIGLTVVLVVTLNNRVTESINNSGALAVEVPRVAEGGSDAIREVSSNRVTIHNAKWDGNKWLIYGGKKEEKGKLLTNRLISAWYYPKSRKTEVVADILTDELDESSCSSIVEDYTLVHDIIKCANHWHLMHDQVMPVMASLPSDDNVRKRLYQTRMCKHEMFTKLDLVDEHRKYPDDIPVGTCFRTIVFQGSQDLNMYIEPTTETKDKFRLWRSGYLTRMGIQDKRTTGGVVWIGRRKSREVVNRAEIISRLKYDSNIHARVVFLEDLNLEDQIKTFVNADVVVGPHGAGLGKVMFMRPGTTMIELYPWGMGKDAPGLWEMPDKSIFRKGDNFKNVGKCVGIEYHTYDAQESDMIRSDKPEGYSNPKKTWGKTVPLSDYAKGLATSQSLANKLYVGDKETKFSVDVKIVSGMIASAANKY